MHTEGVAEHEQDGQERWLVRWECRSCGHEIGLDGAPAEARSFVDRLTWTDEARQRLDRMPPYVQGLLKHDVEQYARSRGERVITLTLLDEARYAGSVPWDAEAEQRLANVPSGVRAMARIELERTALEQGHVRVTVSLMEEVKARYFGIGRTAR